MARDHRQLPRQLPERLQNDYLVSQVSSPLQNECLPSRAAMAMHQQASQWGFSEEGSMAGGNKPVHMVTMLGVTHTCILYMHMHMTDLN